jgi:hypothetical protein
MAARFTLVGDGAWVPLGTSEDTFEAVGATPEVVSTGFTLRADDGALLTVPAGVQVRPRGLERARRRPLDYVDVEGFARTSYSFELPPSTVLFIPAGAVAGTSRAYRGEPVRFASAQPLILAGSPEALTSIPAAEPRGVSAILIASVALFVLAFALALILALGLHG